MSRLSSGGESHPPSGASHPSSGGVGGGGGLSIIRSKLSTMEGEPSSIRRRAVHRWGQDIHHQW